MMCQSVCLALMRCNGRSIHIPGGGRKYFMIFSFPGSTHMVFFIRGIGKVEYADIGFLFGITAYKGQYIFLCCMIIDPGKSCFCIFRAVKSRCRYIEMIQRFHKGTETFLQLSCRLLRQSLLHIFKRSAVSGFLSHKDRLAADMRHQITVKQHQVFPFQFLQLIIAVHTADQSALSEIDAAGIHRQDITLTILINTALRQFVMICVSCDRISG